MLLLFIYVKTAHQKPPYLQSLTHWPIELSKAQTEPVARLLQEILVKRKVSQLR